MTTRHCCGGILVDGGVIVVCAPMFGRWRQRPFAELRLAWPWARYVPVRTSTGTEGV